MSETHSPSQFPHLREVLDDRFAELSDAELEASFESAFGAGVTPAEYEEFFKGLGSMLQKVAPSVQAFGAGALKGATAGSALGFPGLIGGAVLGGTGSLLQKHGRGTARDVGGVLGGVVNTAGMLSGRGGLVSGLGAALGGGGRQGAAGFLRAALGRPEVGAAIGALAQGRNPSIPVGPAGTPVPASDFAGLLSGLAKEAESEALGGGPQAIPGYLMDSEGTPVVDPADPDQRAGWLLRLLAGAAGAEAAAEAEAEAESDERDPYSELDDAFELDEVLVFGEADMLEVMGR